VDGWSSMIKSQFDDDGVLLDTDTSIWVLCCLEGLVFLLCLEGLLFIYMEG